MARREDWERLAALHLHHRLGHGIRQTARALGFPRSTIHDWLRRGADGIRDERLREVGHRVVGGATLTAAEEAEVRALTGIAEVDEPLDMADWDPLKHPRGYRGEFGISGAL